jgi:uncharacterized protein YnzC (UPF0291/DUF896 family)
MERMMLMVTKEQIERINELYKKKNDIGLSEEELKEQEVLRRLYIDSYKSSLKSQLETIKVVTPEEYDKLSVDKDKHSHVHSKNCDCGSHGHKH